MNIFTILGHLNNRDATFFTDGDEAERKGIAPIVLMRWMTGTSDALQVIQVNASINKYAFTLYKHPDLLMKMLASCGPNKFRKYGWLKFEGGKHSIKQATFELFHKVYGYSISDYKDIEDLLTLSNITDLALDCGYQQDQINTLLKEWGEKPTKQTKTTKTKSTTNVLTVDDSLFE